ncbi:MAG: DUF748 domain-containing protein [Deltaproteobacteria bacterium]|nr:DUF748 domain-containing protein [Deltaproteobacteria bacterium]
MKERVSSILSNPAYRKGMIAGLIFVVAYTLFGFFGVPAILSSTLPKMLSEELSREATIREIRFHPYELSVSMRGLKISERDAKGTWISAEEVFANLQIASILRGGPVLSEVRLLRPYVNIVRRPDGRYNFMDLIEKYTKKPTKKTKPLKFSFNNIQLVDGRIDFDDGPKKTRHEIRGIHLSLPFLSNLPYYVDRYIQPSFAATVNGKAVSLKGRTKPFSDTRETVFDINVSDLDIPYYLEYMPTRRNYEVPTAHLDVRCAVSFSQPKGMPPIVRVEGDVTLRQLRILEKNRAPMVFLPMAKVTILPSDVIARELRVSRLTVTDPEIDAAIDRNGKLNLRVLSAGNDNDIARSGEAAGPGDSAEAGSPPVKVSVESIRLSGGKVRFTDASRHAPFKTALGDLRIDVDRLSTEKGKAADALLSTHTEAGETLEWKGNLILSPFASEGTVSLGKGVLKKYAPYYGGAVRFDVTGGTLDLHSGYRIARREGDTEILVSGLSVGLADLRLKRRDDPEEFLRVPTLSVRNAAIDLGKREIVIEEALTSRGTVAVRRGQGGELNLADLVEEGRPHATPSASASSGGKSGRNVPPGKPWGITLRKAAIERYAMRFVDRTTDPPVDLSLDPIHVRAENVSTERNRRGKVSFSATVAREGTVSIGGAFSVDPPSLRARVRVKSLPIGPAHPYFTEKVKILVTAGSVSATGDLSVDAPKGKPLSVLYKGEATVNGFSSMDKARGEEFLKFASLHVGGMEAGNGPPKVEIGEIALTDFYSRIVVNPDATLNVQGIIAKGGAAGDNATVKAVAAVPADAAKPPPTPVRIESVTLQGGTILFSDRYVKPNYTASLVEIGGRISGLSSEESRQADVDLRGKLEKSAPLEIVGKINPLAENLFVDLKVDFSDMDLSPLSPYTGRYAGYGIRKGKLALGLKYHIAKRKLDAENKVFLDQFTFGDPVDSPDATKLPVRLAVALLKDRNGEIHLDLPVTGRIDDPKFSVWGIVVKIVVNLLVKAATSPFALLGAIFGGGEELSYLEFDPGMAALPGTAEAKIGNLAKVLEERPGLRLEIEGHVDEEKDAEGLRRLLFRRKVAARKVGDLVRSGQAAPALDNVRVEPAEYPKYLVQAYKEGKFPKPRNFLGMAKDLPVPEMEKLMLAHTPVTNDDLRQIALQRASIVKDRLILTGKVDPGRIFLVEPKTLPPEKKEKLRDSRVDFRIK